MAKINIFQLHVQEKLLSCLTRGLMFLSVKNAQMKIKKQISETLQKVLAIAAIPMLDLRHESNLRLRAGWWKMHHMSCTDTGVACLVPPLFDATIPMSVPMTKGFLDESVLERPTFQPYFTVVDFPQSGVINMWSQQPQWKAVLANALTWSLANMKHFHSTLHRKLSVCRQLSKNLSKRRIEYSKKLCLFLFFVILRG